MNVEYLLHKYGYIAVFFGASIEGEFLVSLAGVLAYRGILHAGKVIVVSTLGTLLSEQICFYIGRRFGSGYMERKFTRVGRIIRSHQVKFILSCRFLYGLRTISPFLIGACKVHPAKFSFYNCIAAILWSVISVGLGYISGYCADQLGWSTWAEYVFSIICTVISVTFAGMMIRQAIHLDR